LASASSWVSSTLLEPTPAASVLGALLLTTAIATLPSMSGDVALAVFGCAAAAAAFSKPDLKRLSIRLGLALGLIGMLTLPFLISGDLTRAARLGLRALGAATVALTFTSRLSGTELARALGGLRAPAALVEVLEGLALQLDSLKRTAERLVLARRLRGARGIFGTLSVVPELLVRSAERAERLDLARRLRGYEYARSRSHLSRQDLWPLLTAVAGAVLLHALAS